ARRVGRDGVTRGPAQVGGGKAFQDFVCYAVGGGDGQIQRLGIGDPNAFGVRWCAAKVRSEALDLVRGSVNQSDADAQAAKKCDVEEQVGEVVVLDNCAIDGDDEHAVTETWDVTKNLAEIGESKHRLRPARTESRGSWSV